MGRVHCPYCHPIDTVVNRVLPSASAVAVIGRNPVHRFTVAVGGDHKGNAHAYRLGHVTQAAVVERIDIGDAGFVARHSAATGSVDQVADQIAGVVGVVFGDGRERGPAVHQHGRVVGGCDGNGQRVSRGLCTATAHIAVVVDRQRKGLRTAVVRARCIDQCGHRRVYVAKRAGNGHAVAGIGARIHRDAGCASQGDGAVQNTQHGAQVVVACATIIAVNNIHIAEAYADNADGGIFCHGLGNWLGNGGRIVDIGNGDACRVAGR